MLALACAVAVVPAAAADAPTNDGVALRSAVSMAQRSAGISFALTSGIQLSGSIKVRVVHIVSSASATGNGRTVETGAGRTIRAISIRESGRVHTFTDALFYSDFCTLKKGIRWIDAGTKPVPSSGPVWNLGAAISPYAFVHTAASAENLSRARDGHFVGQLQLTGAYAKLQTKTTVPIDIWLDGHGRLRRIRYAGEASKPEPNRWTIDATFTAWNVRVPITRPAASEVAPSFETACTH